MSPGEPEMEHLVLLAVLGSCAGLQLMMGDSLLPKDEEEYDLRHVVTEFGLQYCTIVEIGQGHCSLFAEFRESLEGSLEQGRVAEVFLGECDCSTLREWELCGPELKEAKGEACKFKEGTGRDPSSARVHRRFCDFDHILLSPNNKNCDCSKKMDENTRFPVRGFLTCYRSPLPDTLCNRHSVCGVHRCMAEIIDGIVFAMCDPLCKGRQPFCEDPSKPPLVNSYWSEWVEQECLAFSSTQISESTCLSRDTRAPAFDCLGPGAYCCPQKVENCFCDVETTPNGRKVTRFLGIETSLLKKRHEGSNGTAPRRIRRHWLWDRILGRTRKPAESFVVDYTGQGHKLNMQPMWQTPSPIHVEELRLVDKTGGAGGDLPSLGHLMEMTHEQFSKSHKKAQVTANSTL